MPKLLITEGSIKSKCLPSVNADAFYWDTILEGFGVRVKRDGSRHFIVQRKLPGTSKSLRGTLGRWTGDKGSMTLTQARDEAGLKLAQIRDGVNPFAVALQTARATVAAQTWETFTLQQAIDEHTANMVQKQDAQRSIDQLKAEMTANLADWLGKRLTEIDSVMCIDRHRELSKKNGRRGGRTLANRVMTDLCVCWRSARRRYPKLPDSPTAGVTRNKTSRKRSPIPWEQLPAFIAAVEGIENGIRKDLQLTCLFTGARVTSVCELKWENIDFDKGTIHFVKVKGGEDRAFVAPCSSWLLALLAKRQLANKAEFGDTPYVFPTRNRAGEIVRVQESKEYRYSGGQKATKKVFFFQYTDHKARPQNATPHRLRDTFIAACFECEPPVGFTETMCLVNHAQPNSNVTEGYYRPSITHLRAGLERATAFLLSKAGVQASGLPAKVSA